MSGDEPSNGPRAPRLVDLLALVVGFGAAATLMRSLWPAARTPTAAEAVLAGGLHLWLGTAMAGPLLLLLDRRGLADATRQLSWAQVAWLLIGAYWLAIAALVVPTRMDVSPVFGAAPIALALAIRLLTPRAAPTAGLGPRSWTDRVAIALMITWPLAWGALVLLSKTFL